MHICPTHRPGFSPGRVDIPLAEGTSPRQKYPLCSQGALPAKHDTGTSSAGYPAGQDVEDPENKEDTNVGAA